MVNLGSFHINEEFQNCPASERAFSGLALDRGRERDGVGGREGRGRMMPRLSDDDNELAVQRWEGRERGG